MAGVVQRNGTTIDGAGFIQHHDRPSTYEKADKIAGFRLDRRKNYAIINGEVCEATSWTQECSGCNGAGCDECGHTGRRRQSHWVPVSRDRVDSGGRNEA